MLEEAVSESMVQCYIFISHAVVIFLYGALLMSGSCEEQRAATLSDVRPTYQGSVEKFTF